MTFFISLGRFRKKTFLTIALFSLAGAAVSSAAVTVFKDALYTYIKDLVPRLLTKTGFSFREFANAVAGPLLNHAKGVFIMTLAALTVNARAVCTAFCAVCGLRAGFSIACLCVFGGPSVCLAAVLAAVSLFSLAVEAQYAVVSCVFSETVSKRKAPGRILRDKRCFDLAFGAGNAFALLLASLTLKYAAFELL